MKKNIKIKASKIAKSLSIKFNYKDFDITGVASIDKIKNNHLSFYTDTINNKFKLTEKKTSILKNYQIKEHSNFNRLKNSKKINNKKLISKNPRFDFQKII